MKTIFRLWGQHFLGVELSLCIAAESLMVWWAISWGGGAVLDGVLDGNRAQIYSTMASLFGVLLGFVITMTTIVLGYATQDRLSVVRKSPAYGKIWKTFMSANWTLSLATVAPFIAMIIDRDASPRHWIMYVCMFFSMLAIVRMIRCMWILGHIIALVTAPSPNST
jgi:hypothetical protein